MPPTTVTRESRPRLSPATVARECDAASIEICIFRAEGTDLRCLHIGRRGHETCIIVVVPRRLVLIWADPIRRHSGTVTNVMISESLIDEIVGIRRDLHQHPELSWCEERTAERVCDFLSGRGIAFRAGVAGTGVLAELPGKRKRPFVALRADMDALPVHEETGLPFASATAGVMHACGHDGHTSMLLGAAAQLKLADPPELPIRFIFQPAEETGEGARAMIEAGALDDVAVIFGGHLDRHFETGTIAVTDGPVNASSDHFVIDIWGRGGHAGRPHETVDAVVVGSLLVMSIQTIVSREVNPAHPSVVSVGQFAAGTAGNVIADRAQLSGSIRAQDSAVRESLHASIERIANSVGQLHGAEVKTHIRLGTPPLINQPAEAELSRQAAIEAVGTARVEKMTVANMGGEDFAYYLQHIPGCYVRFGARGAASEGYPAHSSRFDFDERALAVGAMYYASVARLAARRVIETAA